MTADPGILHDVVTYLEMTARPDGPRRPKPAAKLALMRAEDCPAAYYRYLYREVGEAWLWFERLRLDDAALGALIREPGIEISVLHVGGVPAGYFELDRGDPENVELAYFGLAGPFIGRGLGAWFLEAAIDAAWQGTTRRIWVHTCTFDHPRALGGYQRAGFTVYDRRRISFPDPRLAGLVRRDLAHPLLPALPPE